jgi:hypothetical protein
MGQVEVRLHIFLILLALDELSSQIYTLAVLLSRKNPRSVVFRSHLGSWWKGEILNPFWESKSPVVQPVVSYFSD